MSIQGLERAFQSQALVKVDVGLDCNFKDYISPNEWDPKRIEEHLKQLRERGVMVSTGTARTLFDLLFVDEQLCEGMVVRDINPRVKAFNDWEVLLLRISENPEEFLELSQPIAEGDDEALKERLDRINDKMGNLPSEVQTYYREHLNGFGKVYYREKQEWKFNPEVSKHFKGCHYHLDKAQFFKLQRFAKAGNIITTLGSINDLGFLSDKKVIWVNTSNICDYIFINLKGIEKSCPRVVHCQGTLKHGTTFYSHVHEFLTEEEKLQFEHALQMIERCHGDLGFLMSSMGKLLVGFSKYTDPLDNPAWPVYSFTTFSLLKKYVESSILEVPGIGLVDMKMQIDKLNGMSREDIHILCGKKETLRFLDAIVHAWDRLEPSIFMALSEIPGWDDAIENKFSRKGQNLTGFLNRLKSYEIYNRFEKRFGAERVAGLLKQAQTLGKRSFE